MTQVSVGSGIEASEVATPEPNLFVQPDPVEIPSAVDSNILDHPAVRDLLETMRMEFASAVHDVERRLGQNREIERSIKYGEARSTHSEDLNITKPLIDGYLSTANAPQTGSFSWSDLHIVLAGVDYTIADGNMVVPNSNPVAFYKYAWFVKPSSYTAGTALSLMRGDNIPILGSQDALVFVNDSGRPVSVLESTIPYAVGPGVINNAMLAQDVKLVLQNLQQKDLELQSGLDGNIVSYYQDEPPWPAGSPSTGGGNLNQGDIWYDSNDGGAFRWTGATPGSGITPNAWIRIADTSVAEVRALAGTKITTYIGTTAPVAPATGFTVGDMWIDQANGNVLKRWQPNPSTPGWVALQLGDGAISGVSGAKIGSGIKGGNIDAGTVTNTQIGTGISGTKLAAGTTPGTALQNGTVSNTQMAVGAIQPKNINAQIHLLY